MFNLDKICRLCLTEEGVHSNLFADSQDATTPPLYEKVMCCISVKVHQGDGLPASLCDTCVDRINTTWYFKQTSRHIDTILRKFVRENIVNLEERIKLVANEVSSFQTQELGKLNEIPTADKISGCSLCGSVKSRHKIREKSVREQALIKSNEQSSSCPFVGVVNTDDSNDDLPELVSSVSLLHQSTQIFENVVDEDLPEAGKEKKTKGRSDYVCEFCGRKFARSNHLLQHELTHKAEKPFHCTDCGKSFWYKASLIGHEKQTHTGDVNYTCELCGKGFFKKTDLARHKPSHSNETPHKCPQCGLGFKITKTLKRHMQNVHGTQRAHICETCGKSYSQLQTLKVHMVLHTGVKPYVCSYCGKGFAQSAPLKSHIRTHTGEKPYTCHVCLASFTTCTSLSSHAFKHRDTLPFPCSHCSEAFRLKRELTRHMQGHHDEESSHGSLHSKKLKIP